MNLNKIEVYFSLILKRAGSRHTDTGMSLQKNKNSDLCSCSSTWLSFHSLGHTKAHKGQWISIPYIQTLLGIQKRRRMLSNVKDTDKNLETLLLLYILEGKS